MNKVILLGRLVKDIEIIEIKSRSGELISLGNAAIAVNHSKEDSSFFDLKMFGKQAELMDSLTCKGKRILIEGVLKQEVFKTKEGQNRSKVVVMVSRFDVIDFKDKEEECEDAPF